LSRKKIRKANAGKSSGDSSSMPQIRLPKDALAKINLGQSFAEYDRILLRPGVFVKTPATEAASDPSRSKCFFVGRRGTGKTAIAMHLSARHPTAIALHPQAFNAISMLVTIPIDKLRDVNQRPFRSLIACFQRALEDEVLLEWIKCGLTTFDQLPSGLRAERNYLEQCDFDLRILEFVDKVVEPLLKGDEKEWLKQLSKAKQIRRALDDCAVDQRFHRIVTIDRIDDSWDGSDHAVVFLMALMHACIELSSSVEYIRPLLFLRENIFERVRQIDNEFARVETCVVSLDWTEELLIEMIERRLQLPLNPKPRIGETWDYFFEQMDGKSSRPLVFEYCQRRPRDVLTYCELAIDAAQSKRHEKVLIEDFQDARHRFSDSRFKDLCDEYSENFPQLQLVLSRFHGLGREFTLPGIDTFIKKLLVDDDIRVQCEWVYSYTTPDTFVKWLFGIGFVGIRRKGHDRVDFRSLGARSSIAPTLDATASVVVHPTFVEALGLQDKVVGSLDETISLQAQGLLIDLPEAIDLKGYQDSLNHLLKQIKQIERGTEQQAEFEDWVGEVVRLCFFRALTNLAPQQRDFEGRVRRDWIAANRAQAGFWEMVRGRYQATQVLVECKNYSELQASDFHQVVYYMTKPIGTFAVLVFRGEIENHYYGHIKRIASDKGGDGMVLMLTERDMLVFIRQSLNGRVKESHIQDIYDRTVRAIS